MTYPEYRPEQGAAPRMRVIPVPGTRTSPVPSRTWVGVLSPGFPTATPVVRPWVPGVSTPTQGRQVSVVRENASAGERGAAITSAMVSGVLLFAVLATPVALFTLGLSLLSC